MESRATYLVDGRRYQSSHGAVGLDLDLLAGPGVFVPFAAAHTEVAGPWYDDETCEAGVLVDGEAGILLLFAWEGVFASTRTRAAAFALLRLARPGWRVRWLYDGQRGLRAYVGAEPCGYLSRVVVSPALDPGARTRRARPLGSGRHGGRALPRAGDDRRPPGGRGSGAAGAAGGGAGARGVHRSL